MSYLAEGIKVDVYLSKRLKIVTGDITTLSVDAIVNAANSSLYGGGGVDGAIHRAGGPEILSECKEIRTHRYPDGLPPGKAVLTTAGNMKANHVIHTVGPIWHSGTQNERETLANAYKNCLILASESNIKSIAFPAISTGIYGFPKKIAAVIAVEAIENFLKKNILPKEVSLVFFSESDKNTFITAVEKSKLSV
ncbi:MAG: O-acetyl-ADP-ribose deacetylase [Spirochaetales bacterium]|nr:O-acetyl-ADP-ribose deacetylase [Spirochaetales bacterium]